MEPTFPTIVAKISTPTRKSKTTNRYSSSRTGGGISPIVCIVMVQGDRQQAYLKIPLALLPLASGCVLLMRLGAVLSSGPRKRSRKESGRSSSSSRLLQGTAGRLGLCATLPHLARNTAAGCCGDKSGYKRNGMILMLHCFKDRFVRVEIHLKPISNHNSSDPPHPSQNNSCGDSTRTHTEQPSHPRAACHERKSRKGTASSSASSLTDPDRLTSNRILRKPRRTEKPVRERSPEDFTSH
ncbi:hypothetical protein FQN60_000977 [Etheostoma spectabile]|uniref:Uncharacterized protein n=1 Tax=Etheostoma spectabile TaxID=54343 RepID=A0A5J5D6G6_9PERO|nr:hypothetical protein FQN60_000977 [Etheostoma spectabile]